MHVIGYFRAPYCQLRVEHVLVAFDRRSHDNGYLAYAPAHGWCTFAEQNTVTWVRIALSEFSQVVSRVRVPSAILRGVGSQVEDTLFTGREGV